MLNRTVTLCEGGCDGWGAKYKSEKSISGENIKRNSIFRIKTKGGIKRSALTSIFMIKSSSYL